MLVLLLLLLTAAFYLMKYNHSCVISVTRSALPCKMQRSREGSMFHEDLEAETINLSKRLVVKCCMRFLGVKRCFAINLDRVNRSVFVGQNFGKWIACPRLSSILSNCGWIRVTQGEHEPSWTVVNLWGIWSWGPKWSRFGSTFLAENSRQVESILMTQIYSCRCSSHCSRSAKTSTICFRKEI